MATRGVLGRFAHDLRGHASRPAPALIGADLLQKLPSVPDRAREVAEVLRGTKARVVADVLDEGAPLDVADVALRDGKAPQNLSEQILGDALQGERRLPRVHASGLAQGLYQPGEAQEVDLLRLFSEFIVRLRELLLRRWPDHVLVEGLQNLLEGQQPGVADVRAVEGVLQVGELDDLQPHHQHGGFEARCLLSEDALDDPLDKRLELVETDVADVLRVELVDDPQRNLLLHGAQAIAHRGQAIDQPLGVVGAGPAAGELLEGGAQIHVPGPVLALVLAHLAHQHEQVRERDLVGLQQVLALVPHPRADVAVVRPHPELLQGEARLLHAQVPAPERVECTEDVVQLDQLQSVLQVHLLVQLGPRADLALPGPSASVGALLHVEEQRVHIVEVERRPE
eukprot:CAMPEP_0176210408 /NCGR_PEP_ID=MMETSP0121_2-20121125/14130_1 /TAXON_ID=160619 /ORGANISM="Kryptoperidinium foliaceum, Strain CCMP 1326" /LENGTH=396 /DNA_ID=CAMNT_0017549443 /DNA_START=279 /DNA_END=1466 /DNA_ORIENTATION=+